jgi:hypothetical protein
MNKDHFEHLKEVNRTFYDQVKIADQKAAYIFTFLIALLIWSSEAKRVFTPGHYEGASPLSMTLSLVVAVSLLICLASAILVVIPRKVGGGTSLFWGSWAARAEPLRKAAETDDIAMLADEYRGNIANLAAICRAKYLWAGIALKSLAVAVIGYLLLLAFA